MMLSNGEGTHKDSKKSFEWCSKSAKQGVYLAQYQLAVKYRMGEGTLINYTRSYMWELLAKYNGFKSLKPSVFESEMSPTSISQAQAMAEKCLKSDYKDCF